VVDRKHITEATDETREQTEIRLAFKALAFLCDETDDFPSGEHPETVIKRALTSFEKAQAARSLMPAEVVELVGHAHELAKVSRTLKHGAPSHADLIDDLADALAALSSVPPVRDISDEELLAEYERAYRWADTDVHHYAHIAALRAVAALSSTEGTGR
jgi:hypothetical protein